MHNIRKLIQYLCQETTDHLYVSPFLDSLPFSSYLSNPNTSASMSLLHSFIRNSEIRQCKFFNFILCLQNCFCYSSCIEFLYRFQIKLVNFYKRIYWDFTESINQIGGNWHLNHVESFDPWTQSLSPYIQVFFNFSQ